jgi:hypothetical protein
MASGVKLTPPLRVGLSPRPFTISPTASERLRIESSFSPQLFSPQSEISPRSEISFPKLNKLASNIVPHMAFKTLSKLDKHVSGPSYPGFTVSREIPLLQCDAAHTLGCVSSRSGNIVPQTLEQVPAPHKGTAIASIFKGKQTLEPCPVYSEGELPATKTIFSPPRREPFTIINNICSHHIVLNIHGSVELKVQNWDHWLQVSPTFHV